MALAKLTSCEQLVMKVIWDAEKELGLMDIIDVLNREYQKDWKPQTVSTFLSRLGEKGYVENYRQGRIFYYRILIPKEKYLSELTVNFLEFWHNGSAVEFLASVQLKRPLRPDEIDKIRNIIRQNVDLAAGETDDESLSYQ